MTSWGSGNSSVSYELWVHQAHHERSIPDVEKWLVGLPLEGSYQEWEYVRLRGYESEES